MVVRAPWHNEYWILASVITGLASGANKAAGIAGGGGIAAGKLIFPVAGLLFGTVGMITDEIQKQRLKEAKKDLEGKHFEGA